MVPREGVRECEHWGLLRANVVLCVGELYSELTQTGTVGCE